MRCIAVLVLVFYTTVLGAVEVKSTGVGYGSGGGARAQALTSAMREAVRQGVGVDLVSNTQVTNFELDYDRVMTSAFGYISSYKILSQEVNKQGDYTVTIKADVVKGRPNVDNTMALKTIIKRKGSPRVTVKVNENLSGINTRRKFSEALLKESAMNIGLKMTSGRRSLRNRNRLNGSKEKDEAMADSDVVIYVDVEGAYNGEESAYGMSSKSFDISFIMEAIWTDTGETITVTDIPNKQLFSTIPNATQAVGDVIKKLLKGTPDDKSSHLISNFYSKIVTKWITELDLGSPFQIEIIKPRRDDIKQLVSTLKEDGSITEVILREFDAENSAILDIITQLNPSQLTDLIIKGSKKQLDLIKSRKLYLRFAKK